MTHKEGSLQKHISLKVKWRTMHKFTPVIPRNTVAEILVVVKCNQLSNVPYIFRHCDLLDPNKIHEKKLHVNNTAFTDCYTENVIMNAN